MPASSPTVLQGPKGSLTVIFGEADDHQRAQCLKLGATSFRQPLSAEDYLKREEYLDQRPLTQNGGMRYWCIYLESDPAQVLATCRTIGRDVVIRDARGCRQEKCYCIASVITDPEFRKYGLASLLLERVAEWMDGEGDATASMLFQSIGDFYAKRGWKSFPALKSALSYPHTGFESKTWADRPTTHLLSSEDITLLCARDVEEIKLEFEKRVPSPNEVLMAVLPTAHLVSWLHNWGNFISLTLNGKVPEAHGARCESSDSWVYWHPDFRKRALGIQRARTSTNVEETSIEALASLLFDALKEAHRWKLPAVYVWNPTPGLLQAMQYLQGRFGIEVETSEQIGSVPSVRWRGADQSSDLKLPLNEHYAWS